MQRQNRISQIIRLLEKDYPEAQCSLEYMKDYELLFATRLAAQCTDERVNKITPAFYKAYPSLEAIAGADISDVETYIRSCGFYHMKARDIVGAAQMIVRDFGGRVPDTMEDLLKLPGVGRKTANLILGDVFGKPAVPVYGTLGHIPLLIAWPGRPAGPVDALTTSVDLHATLCDVFGVTPGHRTHGRSLVPLVTGDADSVRDWALTGVWGQRVQVVDGHRRYARSPLPVNRPLSMWSNRWSTMPIPAYPGLRLPRPDDRARLDRMPGSDVPVIRQPYGVGDPVPYWGAAEVDGRHLLFDTDDDPAEEHDRAGTPAEAEMEELLRHALADVEAPDDQYERLGLA